MIFIKQDSFYGKVFSVDDKGIYKKIVLGTGDKQQDGTWKNSSWNCRLVGKAKDIQVSKDDRIKVTSAKIENVYDKKNNKSWLNVIIFNFENDSGFVLLEDDDELPF